MFEEDWGEWSRVSWKWGHHEVQLQSYCWSQRSMVRTQLQPYSATAEVWERYGQDTATTLLLASGHSYNPTAGVRERYGQDTATTLLLASGHSYNPIAGVRERHDQDTAARAYLQHQLRKFLIAQKCWLPVLSNFIGCRLDRDFCKQKSINNYNQVWILMRLNIWQWN